MDPVAVYTVGINTRYLELNGKRYVSFTPSPNDNKEAYFYGESLRCDMVSYQRYLFPMDYGDHIAHCKSYLKGSVAKLLYNNFDVFDSLDELSSVFQLWILSWEENRGLEESGIDPFNFSHAYCTKIWGTTKKAIESMMDRDTVKKSSHWYPLSIEFIQDIEVRKLEKYKCRSAANKNWLRNSIEEVAHYFRVGPYDVLPTVKDISSILDYSEDVIRRHGEGLYISASIQKLQLVRIIMDEKPNLMQNEVKTEMDNIGVAISLSHLKKIISDIKNGG